MATSFDNNPTETETSLETMLLKAAETKQLDVVRFLITNGCLNGKTPTEKLRLINRVIVAIGPLEQLDGPTRWPVLDVITGKYDNCTIRMLRAYETIAHFMVETEAWDLSDALEKATVAGRLDIVELLVRAPNGCGAFFTAIRKAQDAKQEAVLKFLLSVHNNTWDNGGFIGLPYIV
jgi:hypothetical protein